VRDSSKPSFIQNIYHIDAYRVGSKDILAIGWEEIIANNHNVIIVEWAEKIRGIIPKRAIRLELEHLEENKRKISIK
jgi:tRNA threonylcarbamoyladenosine biosynthesis protein TsaE